MLVEATTPVVEDPMPADPMLAAPAGPKREDLKPGVEGHAAAVESPPESYSESDSDDEMSDGETDDPAVESTRMDDDAAGSEEISEVGSDSETIIHSSPVSGAARPRSSSVRNIESPQGETDTEGEVESVTSVTRDIVERAALDSTMTDLDSLIENQKKRLVENFLEDGPIDKSELKNRLRKDVRSTYRDLNAQSRDKKVVGKKLKGSVASSFNKAR